MIFGKKKEEAPAPEVVDKAALVLTKDETKWGRTKKWLKPVIIIAIILFILWELFYSLVWPILRRDEVIKLPKGEKIETYDFTPLDGATLPAGVPAYMVPVAHKGNLTLCVCAEGGDAEFGNRGEFCVVQGDGEQIWFSNPQDRFSEAEEAAGKFKWEMYSQLIIGTYDDKSTTSTNYNSYFYSAADRADNKGGFSIKCIDDGFVCYYKFNECKITIPLYVRLNDKGIEVFTRDNEIKQKSKKIFLMNVTILPYFNSGSVEDQGYMLVPDGSGAIINFNNQKNEGLVSNIPKYRADVYGMDTSLRYDYASSGIHDISLPVFGIKNNDTSFVAVITEGDSAASIEAYTSGSKNLQNQVYPVFERYTSGTVTIGERGDWTAREVERYYTDGSQFSEAKVNYLLLPVEKNDYNGMAEAVRNYMLDNAILIDKSDETQDPALFLNFIGGQYKLDNVLGIPTQKLMPFTTVDNINTILDDFNGEGIENVVAIYSGYNTVDLADQEFYTDIEIPRKLGSVKKLRKLYDRLNGKLFLSYNPINMKNSGNGLTVNADTAKDLSGSPVNLYVYSVATGYAGAWNRGSSAITAFKFNELMEEYIENANDTGTNFGVHVDIQSTHYSSFSHGGFISREAFSMYLEEMFTTATKENKVLLNNPLYYQMKYADYAIQVPTESSRYDITDYSIPFYQMVVSGSLDYTANELNFEGNIQSAFMKSLETGSQLYYTFIYENPYELKDTWYDYLYGASYENGFEGAVAKYNELKEAYDKLGSRVVRGYNVLSKEVSETVYENGAKAVFNFGEKDFVTAEGFTVPAENYILISEGGSQL